MGFWKSAAGSLTVIAAMHSLPTVAAPIYDQGAHYVIKFEGNPSNAYEGSISGQITLNADAYRNGMQGEMHASSSEFRFKDQIQRPAGLVSMHINVHNQFMFDLIDARRIAEEYQDFDVYDTYRMSEMNLWLSSGGGLSNFSTALDFLSDTGKIYSDINLRFWGNGKSGTVAGSYGTDIGHSFGCDFGENGRCQFTAPYTVSVPEPASMALLSVGIIGLMAVRRRHKAI